MTKINIKEFEVTRNKNRGINKEWTLCEYYGIHREKHDGIPYNEGSDIEINGMNISVKSPGASLMSGGYCIGCKTFEGIWRRYRKNTHSDTFVFITHDFDAYFMDIDEFSKFIHKFATLAHESSCHRGDLKIRFRDNKAMVKYLEEKVA